MAFAEKSIGLASWSPVCAGLLAGLLVKSGNRSRAAETIGRLGDQRANAVPVAFVVYHLLCGDVEEAAEWMEKALKQRHPLVAMLLLTAPWKSLLRSSGRWPKLAHMMNLPEALR